MATAWMWRSGVSKTGAFVSVCVRERWLMAFTPHYEHWCEFPTQGTDEKKTGKWKNGLWNRKKRNEEGRKTMIKCNRWTWGQREAMNSERQRNTFCVFTIKSIQPSIHSFSLSGMLFGGVPEVKNALSWSGTKQRKQKISIRDFKDLYKIIFGK